MTCREFMRAAELMTPVQLLKMQADSQPLSLHAKDCGACGKWLDSHQLLGNALGALRVSTEQREASSKVERGVLAAFRAQSFASRVVEMPERSPQTLWRMSRFFEVGAYAAAAAAIVVGLFLGARLLQDKRAAKIETQAQTVSAPQVKPAPVNETAGNGASRVVATNAVPASEAPAKKVMRQVRESELSASDSAGYTALMLCDPLICSGDTQVVRMELPPSATEGSAGQPVLADVVIGEDGLIRAMRIVNQ